MLYRSGENLFEGAKSFVDQNEEITVFSAYLKLSVLKRLNNNRNIRQIIVGWELKDLCLGVSDFESIYDYCLDNEIVLYRNTRIHLKALWNNYRSVLFGSANITNKGIGETNKYNYYCCKDTILCWWKCYINHSVRSFVFLIVFRIHLCLVIKKGHVLQCPFY